MTRKPRILFVLATALGWSTYAAQLKTALAPRDDFEWRVFHPARNRWLKIPLKRHHMSKSDRVFRHFDPIQAWDGYLGTWVRREISEFRPDFIHFGDQLPGASILSQSGTPPFSASFDATRRNMNDFLPHADWNAADMEREASLLRKASRLYPWSAWAGDSAAAHYGVDPSRIEVIFPSIDPRMFRPPSPDQKSGGLPKILFIGNDFRRKGGHMLHDWVVGPLNGLCELHIVSRDPAATDLAGPHVVVHGPVPHKTLVQELIPSMDVLCHPTQSDMSAYVVVEASFAGLPSIASGIGGIPELIRHGETGWVVKASDQDGFISRLREAIASPDRLREAGRRARALAQDKFDALKNYDSMFDQVRELAYENARN